MPEDSTAVLEAPAAEAVEVGVPAEDKAAFGAAFAAAVEPDADPAAEAVAEEPAAEVEADAEPAVEDAAAAAEPEAGGETETPAAEEPLAAETDNEVEVDDDLAARLETAGQEIASATTDDSTSSEGEPAPVADSGVEERLAAIEAERVADKAAYDTKLAEMQATIDAGPAVPKPIDVSKIPTVAETIARLPDGAVKDRYVEFAEDSPELAQTMLAVAAFSAADGSKAAAPKAAAGDSEAVTALRAELATVKEELADDKDARANAAYIARIKNGFTTAEGRVVEGHSDLETVRNSKGWKEWVDNMGAGLKAIYNKGTDEQCSDLVTLYKQQRTVAAKAKADGASGEKLKGIKALSKGSLKGGKGSQPSPQNKKDFKGGFADAVKKAKESN